MANTTAVFSLESNKAQLTLLESFSSTETLSRVAEYAGECALISILLKDAEEAGGRARVAAHWGKIVLNRLVIMERVDTL